MEVQEVFRVIMPELGELETFLAQTLDDADPGVRDVVRHLLQAGGKRIRPALVFLAATFGRRPRPDAVLRVAAAAELIHMATLTHDDVLDRADIRRGFRTVHRQWSERVAILAGDYLFAQAFRLLASTGIPEATEIMARVVYEMCQGEIQQSVVALGGTPIDEKTYLDRIGKKTALFLAESCRLGAVVGGADERVGRLLHAFGWGLGLSFQIVDDILDLTASSVAFGKALGTDLKSGILTLPVIHALSHSAEGDRLRRLAEERAAGEGEVEEVRDILGRAGSFAYAESMARRLIADAVSGLQKLPACEARETLATMAAFVVERRT